MKISQLFARKTNPSQQPRCCHKRNDGTGCKAHPRKGRQYCFLHDPASQKKSAAARRAGGVIRGYKAQEVLKLPPSPCSGPSDKIYRLGFASRGISYGSDWTRILRHEGVGGQQCNTLDGRLGHQNPVERVLVNWRQTLCSDDVIADNRQLAVAIVQ